jgi:hypothetical protein
VLLKKGEGATEQMPLEIKGKVQKYVCVPDALHLPAPLNAKPIGTL